MRTILQLSLQLSSTLYQIVGKFRSQNEGCVLVGPVLHNGELPKLETSIAIPAYAKINYMDPACVLGGVCHNEDVGTH
jgi:hypothetical protein